MEQVVSVEVKMKFPSFTGRIKKVDKVSGGVSGEVASVESEILSVSFTLSELESSELIGKEDKSFLEKNPQIASGVITIKPIPIKALATYFQIFFGVNELSITQFFQ